MKPIRFVLGLMVLIGSLGVARGADLLTDTQLDGITARGESQGEEEGSIALPRFPIDLFSLAFSSSRLHHQFLDLLKEISDPRAGGFFRRGDSDNPPRSVTGVQPVANTLPSK